jgi:1-acyl-sn-glycerol-3-phosphate acyltransferase
MKRACRAARWPVVLRTDGPSPPSACEAAVALRQATRETLDLLQEDRAVLIFPEAYPVIDPVWTPNRNGSVLLPFHPGVVRFAVMAARRGIAVPIVPAGFSYGNEERPRVTLRFGRPRLLDDRTDEREALAELECQVGQLSGR